MVGRLSGVVIDCPDPQALADIYEALLGASRTRDSAAWVISNLVSGQPWVSLQRTQDYRAPDWPGGDVPQQMHRDLLVDDLDEAEALVLALGGRLLDGSDEPIGFRVYADPVGHPF